MRKVIKGRLELGRETVRRLATGELDGVIGGFSDPRKSCDSCSNCPCTPP